MKNGRKAKEAKLFVTKMALKVSPQQWYIVNELYTF